MSTAAIHGPIQIANKTAAAWATQNPVLLAGQQGFETDTNKLKIGDGVTTWNLLGYVTGTGGGGGGASRYVDLTDSSTVPLPTTNAPLSAALAAKAPTANPTFTGTVSGITKTTVGLANVDNTSDNSKPVSAAQQAALNAKAPTASPVFTGTVSGVTKVHVGLGSVDNTADTDKPVSTLQAAAIALKADILGAVDLGTGTVTLTAANNGDRANFWHGTLDTTFPISAGGSPTNGTFITVTHAGASGVMTFTGASAATGYKLTLNPNEIGGFEWNGSAWRSAIPSNSGGGGGTFTLATVTGSATVGSTLTCTPASGWTGTFQWTRDGSNISSATASTYLLVSGDASHSIGCTFTPTTFTTNTIPIPAGGGGGSPVLSSAPFGAAAMTLVGASDWGYVDGGDNAGKTGGTAIGTLSLTNLTRGSVTSISSDYAGTSYTTPFTLAENDFGAANGDGDHAFSYNVTTEAGTTRIRFTVTSTTGVLSKLGLVFGFYEDSDEPAASTVTVGRLTCTLSDGSAGPLVETFTNTHQFGISPFDRVISYRPTTGGTLTVDLETGTAGRWVPIFLQAIRYDVGS